MKEYSENGLRIGLSQNSDAQYLGLAKKLLGAVKHAASFNNLQQLQREIVLPNGVRLFAGSCFGIDTVRVVSSALTETQEAQVGGKIVGLVFLIDWMGMHNNSWYGAGTDTRPEVHASVFIPASDPDTDADGLFVTSNDINMDPDSSIFLPGTVGDYLYVDSYKDVPGTVNAPVFFDQSSDLMPYKWHQLIASEPFTNDDFVIKPIYGDKDDQAGHSQTTLDGFYIEIDTEKFEKKRLRFYITVGESIDVPSGSFPGATDTGGGVSWTLATLAPDELENIDLYASTKALDASSVKNNNSYEELKVGEFDTSDILAFGANVNQYVTDVVGIAGDINANVGIGEAVPDDGATDDVGQYLVIEMCAMPYNAVDADISLDGANAVKVGKRIDYEAPGVPAADLPF